MYEFAFQISVLTIVQIVAKLHIAQEVGNVENRKGVNEKYYFSILCCMRKY